MKVSIRGCPEYDYDRVYLAVKAVIDDIGGMAAFVQTGDQVLVKPNLLKKAAPDAGITTHPTVIAAVAALAKEAGGIVTIQDSPGGAFTKQLLRSLYEFTGMSEAAEKSGATLGFTTESEDRNGLKLLKAALQADKVISVGKLKTHSMQAFTGATKNMYGIVPGLTKAEYHYQRQTHKRFAELILEIHQTVTPVLSVLDAVWGMEGEGPAAGEKIKVGAVMASDSSLALDLAACKMIGMKSEIVPILTCAMEQGICPKDLSEVTLLGEEICVFQKQFKQPKTLYTSLIKTRLPEGLTNVVEKTMSLYPHFIYSGCIGCGICVANCPAKALTIKDKKPVLDKKKCIRCYCCHELCPQHTIEMRRPMLWKLVTSLFD